MGQTIFGRAAELRAIAARIGAVRQGGSAIVVSAPPGGGVSTVLAAAKDEARAAGLAVVTSSPGGLADQLVRMLRATEPLLLCVDDFDRVGDDGRETVDVLGDRVCALPVVLLVGTHRHRPRRAAWASVPLLPLSANDACLLLADTGIPIPCGLRERILAEARGNPLALRELPLPWQEGDRPGADVLLRFLPQTLRLREALAGARVTADPRSWTALLTDALVEDEKRMPVGLVRGAIVQSSTGEEVRAAHESAARLVGDGHQRLRHRAEVSGGTDEGLARELAESAGEAGRRLDPVDAVRRLRDAAGLASDRAQAAGWLIEAGRQAYELGRPDLGEELLETAARAGGEPAGLADDVRSRFAGRLTRLAEPVEARCELARRLIDTGRDDAGLDVLIEVGLSLFWSDGEQADVRDRVLGCLVRVPGRRDDPRYLAALAVATPRDARHLVAAATVGERDPEGCRLLAMAALLTGDLVRAADLLTTTVRLLKAAGREGLLTHAQTLLAHVTLTLGDWDTASAAAQDAMRLAVRTDQPLWQLRARALRASVRAMRGDFPGALADCREVDRVAASGHVLGAAPAQSRIALGATLLGQGEWEQAYGVLARLFEPGGDQQIAVRCLDLLAEAALRCQRPSAMTAVVAELAGRADASPLSELNLGYVRALLSDGPAAEQRFAEALAGTPPQWPWLRARIELGLGVWLRRRRRIAESRVHLAAAHRALELLGAAAWARRAAAELRAAGVASDDSTPGTGLLSPQELHVARLAARGLSNREIGQHLTLSPRTVGSHLYRVFPKLDVTSRAQLAARLGRLRSAGDERDEPGQDRRGVVARPGAESAGVP